MDARTEACPIPRCEAWKLRGGARIKVSKSLQRMARTCFEVLEEPEIET